ncbi:Protease 3 precursor [Lacunisphaera limnophila]|uniref:Protease 3 n=1 Tax=Lacunisphaera limnophila TaxID=1838286 RepID=A0A1D8ARY4_9BACT|nr:insulinase family protein [Lacunisphaera limnophila]AOS43658.1 Protease 3 precursor [Lacunisphaera limnophila]
MLPRFPSLGRSPRLALVPLLVLALAPLVRAALPADIPPRPQAPNDEAEYRRFTLDNGLKVILLSDPKLNKSSASLAVAAGSYSDPANRQGLAHFLEHMLFLGTEKYPDEADYGNYLKINGGYNNAYTAGDHTNYLLEIRHEAFEGALDRLSQFFIAPLFTPEFTEREMNAVNSENQKNLENDLWRQYQLTNTLYRPGHPANHFSTGNRDTLGGTTREELLAFYHAHYSANTMTLALVGKASLDELEQWARTYFTPIKNQQLKPIDYPADYLPPKAALRIARMEPIKDVRQLTLEFPLGATRPFWPSKPDRLLGFILGHEGEGSLLSALKAEGLATGMGASADANTKDFGSFNATISLTPAGLEKYPRVLELFFAAISRLRSAGYPAYLFQERAAMARLDETFQDKGEGADRAVALANQIRDFPLEIAEREPYLWLQEDPAAYATVLNQIRPDNMLVVLTAKGVPTDKSEPVYGTKYSYTEETGPAYTALLTPPEVAAIQLPKANPFIPASATVLPTQPIQLLDEPALSLLYAQDTEFQRPMVAEVYRFRLPRALASLETSVLLRFYEACIRESLNEVAYTAGQAGLNFSFNAALEGVEIAVEGYDASAPRLLDTIAANLVDFSLPDERFAAIKDRLLRELGNFPRADAYQILLETRRATVREFHFRPDEQLPVAQGVTLAAVRDFARKLYTRGKLEALVHGNVTAADAIAHARRFGAALASQPVADADLLRRRLLAQPAGEALRTNEQLVVNNSAFRREYVLGDDSPEIRAATLVLGNFISEPFFSELRTRQQLGYIVGANAGGEENTNFAYFIIQSGEYPADEVEKRADDFIVKLPLMLSGLPDDAWASIIGGVRAQLEEKDKAIADRAKRLFALGYDRAGDWNRREETLAALDRLTKARTGEILDHALGLSTRQMRTYLGFARQHEAKAPQTPTYTDRPAWKQTRQFK